MSLAKKIPRALLVRRGCAHSAAHQFVDLARVLDHLRHGPQDGVVRPCGAKPNEDVLKTALDQAHHLGRNLTNLALLCWIVSG